MNIILKLVSHSSSAVFALVFSQETCVFKFGISRKKSVANRVNTVYLRKLHFFLLSSDCNVLSGSHRGFLRDNVYKSISVTRAFVSCLKCFRLCDPFIAPFSLQIIQMHLDTELRTGLFGRTWQAVKATNYRSWHVQKCRMPAINTHPSPAKCVT